MRCGIALRSLPLPTEPEWILSVRQRTDRFDKTVYKYWHPWPESFDFCRGVIRQKIEDKPSPALSAARSVASLLRLAAYENSIMQNQARVNSTADSAGTQRLGNAMSHDPGRLEHRIGILMSQTGRFLECISCRLSFEFPPGTQYETIAKQFESHRCGSVTSSSES